MPTRYLLTLLAFCLTSGQLSGQHRWQDMESMSLLGVDSLLAGLDRPSPDTNQIILLNSLAWVHRGGDVIKTTEYANESLRLSRDLGYRPGEAMAHWLIGLANERQGALDEALVHHEKTIQIGEELENLNFQGAGLTGLATVHAYRGELTAALATFIRAHDLHSADADSLSTAIAVFNTGLVYQVQGDYSRALDAFFKALLVFEVLPDTTRQAMAHGSIGDVASSQQDFSLAKEHYLTALEYLDGTENRLRLASALEKVGSSYLSDGDQVGAIDYFSQALDIYEEVGFLRGQATALMAMGRAFAGLERYGEAVEHTSRARVLAESGSQLDLSATASVRLGGLQIELQDYSGAIDNGLRGLAAGRDGGDIPLVADATAVLARAYAARGEYGPAFEYQGLHQAFRDSLLNESRSKEIGRLEANYQNERREIEAERLRQEQASLEADRRRRNLTFLLSGLGLLLLVTAGGGVHLRGLRKKNRIIEIHRERAERAAASADSANQAKSTFLANMSHEIRTPMNAVLGFTEILNGRLSDGQDRRYLSYIQSSAKSLLTLIDDILDLSKVEAGKLSVDPEVTDIRRLLEEVREIFTYKTEQKGLAALVHVAPSVPAAVLVDEVRLRQVLINLVGNAVKFTSRGQVAVSAECEKTSEDASTLTLRISVEDTGIGIPEDQLDRLFEAFEQREGQKASDYGGTGLGLAISKRLVELMGGRIWATSVVDEGSTFALEIPDLPVAAVTVGKTSEVPERSFRFRPATIAIADDVPINRELVKSYLLPYGFAFLEASDGAELVQLVSEHIPQLVITDLKMPRMSGYEAIRAIRTNEVTRGIPVVALTASTLEQAVERIREVADGLLRKPVSSRDLILELVKHLDHDSEASAASPPTEAGEERFDATALTSQELAGLEQLARHIEAEKARCRQLCENMTMHEIESFGAEMASLGQEFEYPVLTRWGAALVDRAELFELDEVQALLDRFDSLVEDLDRIVRDAMNQ